jgi:hypothetical protein
MPTARYAQRMQLGDPLERLPRDGPHTVEFVQLTETASKPRDRYAAAASVRA